MEKDIDTLLEQMTLEEKISMLAGADQWHTVPVQRLGIPAIKVTDGPNGARGAYGSVGPTSACFPVGTALAATWNPALVEHVGMALAEEVKAKGAHILLAPTVNIHRSPLAGRNFECYSEDPYLTSRMAVAYIKGIQSQGAGACIKHFVCNDSEFERKSISSEVRERALHEIYLYPFRAAIREAKPWAVMSAYNRLNGTFCSENSYLLIDILKKEWGFDGIVMSDWFGTYSPRVAQGGLDLEMPGPARWMGEDTHHALEAGEVIEEAINDKVRRILRTIVRSGAFDNPQLSPEQAIDKPEHRRLAHQAASEAIVLLKNSANILPLDTQKISSIAIIGESASLVQVMGGGSSEVTPHYIVSPLSAIQNKLGDTVAVEYAIGCPIHRSLPALEVDWLTTEDRTTKGLNIQLFEDNMLSGDPVEVKVTTRTHIEWTDGFLGNANPKNFSARISGLLTLPTSGRYTFCITGNGLSRLFIDEQELIDKWSRRPQGGTPWEGRESTAVIELNAGQEYRLLIEYSWAGASPWRELNIGCIAPLPDDPIEQAVTLAARSDIAIVFAGLTKEWESEGFDRINMDLPGKQNELIEKVAEVNPNTIVVLNNGSPLRLPWLEKVRAALQMWYPGQEAGTAITDVLFGEVNPSGRLPQTWPKRLQDNPAYTNYPGENGKVYYGEDIFVGYRYYEKKGIEPLFPFGYGLSYTTFAYKKLSLNGHEYRPGDEIQVSIEIENTGERAGQEVVQLYLRDVEASLARPDKELKAFAKVTLEPREVKTITFVLDAEALSFYNPARKRWVSEAGIFEVLVGSSSQDIHLKAEFTWTGILEPEIEKTARLHVGLPLRVLLEDAGARAILMKFFGEYLKQPDMERALDHSLEDFARFVPHVLFPERLRTINDELATL